MGTIHDERPRWKDQDQGMVRRGRSIHPTTIPFDEEDPVPWRKLSHRVRNEKVSQRAKLEGGVRTLSHRANMHDMRLQDWLSGSWI